MAEATPSPATHSLGVKSDVTQYRNRRREPGILVSLTNKVISQALDGRVGVSSNCSFGVVADDDSLLGLGNGDSFATSSGIDASVLSSSQDETLASQEEALCKGGVFGPFIARNDLGDDLQLSWLEIPATGSCPDAVTGKADDGALVNVPRGDETSVNITLPRHDG